MVNQNKIRDTIFDTIKGYKNNKNLKTGYYFESDQKG